MTDPTPQQDRRASDERPVMGDHRDLEEAEHQERRGRKPEPDSGDMMSRLMMPGIILLVIVVIVIAYFLFVA
jgi:hypothetical protein